MSAATDPQDGRDYLRVSVDSSGREVSPDEQHADLVEDADELGLHLGESYRDVGSASRFAKKARKAFQQLLADLETGRFGADVLLLWEPSRSSRDEGESFRLVDLLEKTGTNVWIHTHQRMFDPAGSWQDRQALLQMALDSAKESYLISDRQKRSQRRRAAVGRAVGPVGTGYRRQFDPVTGELLGRVIDEAEADLVRELFRRVDEGQSIRSIATDWQARGIRNRSGTPYSQPHLRGLLTKRHLIGVRNYKGTTTAGDWPPIIDRELYFRVQEKITKPERVTRRPGGARYFLSMIARCDTCHGPMVFKVKRTQPRYVCQGNGCAQVDRLALDELAEELILTFLADPEQYGALVQPDTRRDAYLTEARTEAAEVRTELATLETQVAAGKLSVSFAMNVEPGLRTRLEKAEARVRELSRPNQFVGLIDPGEDVRARWAALTALDEEVERQDPERKDRPGTTIKRRIAALLLQPGVLGELRVLPVGAGRRHVPVEDRVVFRRT